MKMRSRNVFIIIIIMKELRRQKFDCLVHHSFVGILVSADDLYLMSLV